MPFKIAFNYALAVLICLGLKFFFIEKSFFNLKTFTIFKSGVIVNMKVDAWYASDMQGGYQIIMAGED